MKYGVCTSLDNVKLVASLGYDYIETGFREFVNEENDAFINKAKLVKEAGIPCEAANCFIPGELALNNGNPDYDALKKYIETGMKNGTSIGLKTVVFGSGGARRVPEGGDYGEMYKTLAYFLKECAAPIAKKYGVNIVVEPLCQKDCNIINTVSEGVMLASLCEAENVKGLADLFHMAVLNDSCENIRNAKGWIYHAELLIGDRRLMIYVREPKMPTDRKQAALAKTAEAAMEQAQKKRRNTAPKEE